MLLQLKCNIRCLHKTIRKTISIETISLCPNTDYHRIDKVYCCTSSALCSPLLAIGLS